MACIYLLTNPSMPGVVKIGCTERLPEERAAELYTTGVPTPFELAAYWNVVNKSVIQMERSIHSHLNEFRIHGNREFFKLTPEGAKKRINNFLNSQDDLEKKNIERQRQHEAREKENERCRKVIDTWEYNKDAYREYARKKASEKLGINIEKLQKIVEDGDPLALPIFLGTLGIGTIALGLLGIDTELAASKQAKELLNRHYQLENKLFEFYKTRFFAKHKVDPDGIYF